MAITLAWHLTYPAFAQGPLAPTAAPGPMMKTLQQVEPRIPISALPAAITTSGSYYVTTNLTGVAGSTNGITILANHVTLDLSGFTLLGVAGSGSGITVPNSVENLAIRNGVLDSWGSDGVNAANAYNSLFERLRISNSGETGFATGNNCVVLNCTAWGNDTSENEPNYGISVGYNCTVIGCSASENDDFGIGVGNNCTVKDCTASGNGLNGIDVGNNCTVIGCTASANSGGAGEGIDVGNNCTVIGCTASGNDNFGIDVGNNCTVKDCTASGNFRGIAVGNACLIAGNTCSGNGSFGIEIIGVQNRVDGNMVGNNNTVGIYPESLNVTNSITRNSAAGFGYGNYAGNNDYAPTGSVSTATNPWTNF